MKRRHFLLGAGAVAMTRVRLSAASASKSPAASSVPAERPNPSPLDVALVREFVGAGHGNIPRVKEMLAAHPRLIHATYDWGAGDFETALGGAAHVGRREAALHLLEAGARIDAFCAAMLGETEIVAGLLRLSPRTANVRGPHGYSLLYHAGYSGKLALASALDPHLEQRARDCNEALQTASGAGHAEFVAWLLKHGVDNPNTKNFQGKTPLDVALERKHGEAAALLRAHGGMTSR